MKTYGWITVLAVLVALGLVLRFGKSSNALTNTFFGGVNNILRTVSLSDFQGNTP